MATKAELFKTESQRTHKPTKHKKKRVTPARERGAGAADTRNESKHAGRNGGVVLEVSAGKASRKSSRKSADHTKATTSLQLKAQRKTTAPSMRASRGK